ncbi:MAG TPA: M23 family metallopeptidase [Acidimicrobiales bacterium]|nr:M23 family metallopeptidase [Acidimicrobiales bacterium]
MMTRPGALIIVLLAALGLAAGSPLLGAQADPLLPPLLPPPAPTTTTPPAPGKPVPTTNLVDALLKPPTTPAPTTAPPAAPKPVVAGGTVVPGNAGGEGENPGSDAGPFPADLAAKMNSVHRSRPNNSFALVGALKALTDLGVPADEAMRVGMGRFPVAGRATFIDDWWFPRFGPGWRLHEGTDIFADRNTPVRSPANGVVKFSDGGLGGIAVYVYQDDGTYFYMCHLDHRTPGLKPGQRVSVGDVVGFVGNTGNAAGGATHLHFEVHPASRVVTVGKGKKQTTKVVPLRVAPGTELPATDPKPFLDAWLLEATAQLPAVVASYQANHPLPASPVVAPALPASVVLESHHFSGGGLIAADAPLVRTPLMGLALLLIVMVLVLTPVLAPRRRLVTAGGRPPAKQPSAPRRSRRERKAGAPVTAAPAVLATTDEAAAASKQRRGRKAAEPDASADKPGRRHRKAEKSARPVVEPAAAVAPAPPAPETAPFALGRPWQHAAAPSPGPVVIAPANGHGTASDDPVVIDITALDADEPVPDAVVVDLPTSEGPVVIPVVEAGTGRLRRRRRRDSDPDALVGAGDASA